jgi:sulfide:quinone oxidoreductase
MSRVLILGAGVSGHTAAAFARKWLGGRHEVAVVSPNSEYNWIPSNVWVGVGLLSKRKVVFPLEPVYRRAGITFHHGTAVAIHPEGDRDEEKPFVE